MWHFVIPVTLCNHPPKRLHWVATSIDHLVHVTYCLSLPYHSPFYFCALLLPPYSISILFHILFPTLSVFHILPLSLFHDLLLVAMHFVPYVVPLHLGSPYSFLFGSPLQGMHPSAVLYLSNILWIPLARIWVLCSIVRLPLHHQSSSLRRRMVAYASSNIIVPSMQWWSRIATCFLSFQTLSTSFAVPNTSQSWMCNGGIRMCKWRKVTSGRLHFRQVTGCSNHWWCSLAFQTVLLPSRQWWMISFRTLLWKEWSVCTSTTSSSTLKPWRSTITLCVWSWSDFMNTSSSCDMTNAIQAHTNQIPWTCSHTWVNHNGSNQSCRSHRMACAQD